MTQSQLFVKYNSLRKEQPGCRLNSALGIVQSNSESRPYKTTAEGCNCPDYIYRQKHVEQKCKHMLAVELVS